MSTANPFDIFSPEARGNHALYARMRVADPVHQVLDARTGENVWFLTRYDHCVNFMKDQRFSKEFPTRLHPNPLSNPVAAATHQIINRHMLNLDDPDHARLKTLVHKAFSPARMSTLRPRLQALADGLLEAVDHDVADGGEFDLTERYAEVFPLLSIMALLGFPLEDYPQFRTWTKTILRSPDQAIVHTAIIEFSMYLHRQIDLRHESSTTTDDVLTDLIFAEDGGNRLTRQELLAMVLLLFAAGYETVANFISNGVLSLLENPDQMQLLRDHLDDPLVVRSAIEEMLRYKGPSYMTLPSWAREDVDLGGKIIRKSDAVHAVLYAANRDPAVFDQPDKFDILRYPNKHIAFSQGVHHCLGAPLARLEGAIAITTLLRWMPNL